jgi:hypothetical protein
LSPHRETISTRRHFLNRLGLFGLASSLPINSFLSAGTTPKRTPPQPLSGTSPAIRNAAPLAPSAFYFLPLGSIQPRGWLKEQLRTQANGLSGHLDETWADVGRNSGWLGGTGESWERGPYYLDGLIPLAYMLDDELLKVKARRFVDWVLENQASNGMIGPRSNDDWWPRIVILKALTQYEELTDDKRVIPVMEKYFRYQLGQLPTRPLRDWGKFRWQDELLSVIWLYNRTGSTFLLDLARLLHQQGYDWVAQFANFQYTKRVTPEFLKVQGGDGLGDIGLATHGVNNGQAVKTGPVWSLVSRSDTDRSAAVKMISELNKYHGLSNGMFSCDEHLAGLDPSQGSELCTVVEYMFSLEHSLAIVGDSSLGDRLEQLAFNALPGTFSDDMWAHQYNQEPNQVECSLHRRPWTTDGPESNLFGLEPNFGCCTANFHQGWPKFAASLFMLTGARDYLESDGLVAAVYAPCEVHTTLRGVDVHIVEETGYPFQGSVRFTVSPTSPLNFPLKFRIPAWAVGTAILVNGHAEPSPESGSFAQIERTWRFGDKVEITFPMTPRLTRGFHESIAIERGPLVFSYSIGESWVKLRDRGMTADWQVFPTTPWNYALNVDIDSPIKSIAVIETEVGESPFTSRHTPVRLSVKARKLDEWRAEDGVADPLPQSPVDSDQPEETITLIPYAAAKLRITAFPLVKS